MEAATILNSAVMMGKGYVTLNSLNHSKIDNENKSAQLLVF